MTIVERVLALGLPDGEYAVFSGGLMEALGLRRASDIDLMVVPELYLRLRREGWEEVRGGNATTLNRGDVEAALPGEYVPAAAQIEDPASCISDALTIEGVHFVRPEYVIACKREYENPKHHRDVLLLERYLQEHPEVRRR